MAMTSTEQLRCDGYPSVENGRAIHVESKTPPFDVGTRLTIRCEPGYGISSRTSPWFSCKKSGGDDDASSSSSTAWDPVSAACVPRRCGAPPWIEHGSVAGREYEFGKSVVYECDPGYVSSGLKTYFCGVGGSWTPESIHSLRCDPVRCPDLEEWKGEENGKLRTGGGVGGPNVVGKQVEHVCDPGYRIVDPRTKTLRSVVRTCGLDGEWSGDVPRCEKITCPELPARLADVLGRESRDEGSINVVRCKNGRHHTIKCKMDGAWTGPWPLCPEDHDERETPPQQTMEETEEEEEEDVHSSRPSGDDDHRDGKEVLVETDAKEKRKKTKRVRGSGSNSWSVTVSVVSILLLIFVILLSSKIKK